METVLQVVLILVVSAFIFGISCQFVMTRKVFGYKQLKLLPKLEQSRFILMNLIFAPLWVLKGSMYQPRAGSKRKRRQLATKPKR